MCWHLYGFQTYNMENVCLCLLKFDIIKLISGNLPFFNSLLKLLCVLVCVNEENELEWKNKFSISAKNAQQPKQQQQQLRRFEEQKWLKISYMEINVRRDDEMWMLNK